MSSHGLTFPPVSELRRHLGVVIPTWLPPQTPVNKAEQLLRLTLTDSELFVQPDRCVVVADGCEVAAEAARRIKAHADVFVLLESRENLGKAGALAIGIEHLLENESIQFIAVRDHDNDHLTNELPSLQRLALQMQSETANDLVAVIGGRTSVHRHLGFGRGEFEHFGNEVVFAAVQIRLARDHRVIDSRYWSGYDMLPDMQSGYKFYARRVAALYVRALRAGESRNPLWKLGLGGSEMMPLVEVWLQGGTVGETRRLAWERQPGTTFVAERAVEIKAGILAWCLSRCDITSELARRILENAMARRLWSKDDAGLQTLTRVANKTLQFLASVTGEQPLSVSPPSWPQFF